MNWIPWPESIKKRACRYILQDWISKDFPSVVITTVPVRG